MKLTIRALLFGCALAVALSGSAWAQGEEEGTPPGDDGAATQPVEGGDGAATTPVEGGGETEPAPAVGEVTKANYPEAYIDRGLVIPKGMILAQVGMGSTVKFDFVPLYLRGAYGIIPKLEAGLSTGFLVKPSGQFWDKYLALDAHYLALSKPKFQMSAGFIIPLQFCDGCDVLSGVVIEAPFFFKVTPKIWVQTLHNLLPIPISPDFGMNLQLNLQVGMQAMPKLAVMLDTWLLSAGLFGDGKYGATTSIADATPLRLTGLYAVNKMIDGIVGFGFGDLQAAGDSWGITVGVNLHL